MLTRFRSKYPAVHPFFICDSAWGSFELLKFVKENGANATFSMPKKTWPWLSEALVYGAPYDSGRAAYIPECDAIYSAYNILNDKGEPKTIKTLTSSMQFRFDVDMEIEVMYITQKRRSSADTLEFLTTWSNGKQEWLDPSHFIDDDGTVTRAWLDFVDPDDLQASFSQFSKSQLEVMCHANNWKTSGNKFDLQSRISRHLIELKASTLDWAEDNLKSILGPVVYVTLVDSPVCLRVL